MKIQRKEARKVATDALCAYGIPRDDAELTAEVLVSADARNKQSHGLLRLPRIIRGLKHSNVDPDGTIEVVVERGGAARINGGARLGPVVASIAAAEAMDRADEFGIGMISVHNSNHLGMLGYYTEQILNQGMIGIGMTNTEPAMPAYGGTEPILGTNPIAIGLPTDPVFNLDMSTSGIARGTVLHYQETNQQLPEGVALDAGGDPTTDPEAALNGTILPFGGKKGSGLAIAIEVLAGGLAGADMGTDVTGTYHTEDPCTKGDLFIAIDPEALGTTTFYERTSTFLEELISDETTEGTNQVRLPGSRSIERDQKATFVEIEPELWKKIRGYANSN